MTASSVTEQASAGLNALRRRLRNDTATEYANDLQNVYAITRLRLAKLLEHS